MGTLTKSAQVGNTTFGIGVDERLVIERAQREHEYRANPERYRLKNVVLGACCHGGLKPRAACAACSGWKPQPTADPEEKKNH